MTPCDQRYDEQLAWVRLMVKVEGDPIWDDLSPHDRAALTAVLQHYDAYAAVTEAAAALAVYDDFGAALSPHDLTAPSNPMAMNEARLTLDQALKDVQVVEQGEV